MKRLSLSFVLILSAALIFSVAGLADEADFAQATVDFNSVIDLSVSGTLNNLVIEQNADEGGDVALSELPGGTAEATFSGGPIAVTVVSLTPFSVGSTYYSGTEDYYDSGTGESLLELVPVAGSTGGDLPYYDNTNWNFTNDSGTKPTDILSLPDYSGSTGNNLPDGASAEYGLKIDLSKLSEDYDNGDSVTFDVSFWAYDSTGV